MHPTAGRKSAAFRRFLRNCIIDIVIIYNLLDYAAEGSSRMARILLEESLVIREFRDVQKRLASLWRSFNCCDVVL